MATSMPRDAGHTAEAANVAASGPAEVRSVAGSVVSGRTGLSRRTRGRREALRAGRGYGVGDGGALRYAPRKASFCSRLLKYLFNVNYD